VLETYLKTARSITAMDDNRDQQKNALRFGAWRIGVAVLAAAVIFAPALGAGAVGATTDHAAKGVVIATAKNSTLGTILVSGTTVYTLKPSSTACTAKCLKTWPEVVLPAGVAKATAGSGVSESKLGVVTRSGGVRQVTYAGKALYWFSGDKAAGQVKGNVTDTWGTWSTVVTVKPAASSGSGTSVTTTTNPGTGGIAF
jgi:predicted lipoprotein with Yx(FWY)xxD motif